MTIKQTTSNSDLLKLFSAFNNISFNESIHRYTFDNGKQAMSVTTLLNKFTPYFNAPAISAAIAKRDNRTQADVLQEWGIKSVISTARGKLCHAYLENYYKKRYYDINSTVIGAQVMHDIQHSMQRNIQQNGYTFTGSYEQMYYEVFRQANILINNHVRNFINDMRGGFIPIAQEIVLADERIGVAGMPDIVAYSEKLGKLIVLDWKFNSSGELFDADKKGNITIDNCIIPNSKYNLYSLQIESYISLLRRAAIEGIHNTGFIVHFDVEAPNYALYPSAQCAEIISYVFAQLEAGRK